VARGSLLIVGACASNANDVMAVAYLLGRDAEPSRPCRICFIPASAKIFSRTRGILETNLVAQKRVPIFGLGSGGSIVAVELAKCGVGQFDLVDFDRLELHNVARHCCGVSSLGRYKTKAVRDLLLDKQPGCRIATHEVDNLEAPDVLDDLVRQADVVIAATDNNPSRRALNQACLRHGKVCLYGQPCGARAAAMYCGCARNRGRVTNA
jgi:tRNA A37 threonylcarbamoyladenosine dehydratase